MTPGPAVKLPRLPMRLPLRLSARHALLAAFALLALAVLDPGWTGHRHEHEMIAVLDITQSMDAADMPLPGDPTPVSRLARTRQLLGQAMAHLPCGSRLGLAVFSEYRSLVLLTPVEVCEHYSELKSTLASVNTAMAWSGNSEIAKGLYGSIAAVKALPSHPAIVFFTDGQEAPPVDPRHRPPWNGQPGDAAGLLVGVGGDTPVPIPRHDPEGRAMGTWGAGDVVQRANRGMNPNAPEAAEGPPPAMAGATPGQEHLSALREGYLQMLASETSLGYHRLVDADGLRRALMAPALTHAVEARISLRWPACALALLVLLGLHAAPLRPRLSAPVQGLTRAWRRTQRAGTAAIKAWPLAGPRP